MKKLIEWMYRKNKGASDFHKDLALFMLLGMYRRQLLKLKTDADYCECSAYTVDPEPIYDEFGVVYGHLCLYCGKENI